MAPLTLRLFRRTLSRSYEVDMSPIVRSPLPPPLRALDAPPPVPHPPSPIVCPPLRSHFLFNPSDTVVSVPPQTVGVRG
jgi:hypothetical protein